MKLQKNVVNILLLLCISLSLVITQACSYSRLETRHDAINNMPPEWRVVDKEPSDKCNNLSGTYFLLADHHHDNPNAREMSLPKMRFDTLLHLQSKNWPVKYPLLDKKFVNITKEDDQSYLYVEFHAETVPFFQKVRITECVKGWVHLVIKFDTTSEGGKIVSERHVYMKRNRDADLVVLSRSWYRRSSWMEPWGHINQGDYWYRFRKLNTGK